MTFIGEVVLLFLDKFSEAGGLLPEIWFGSLLQDSDLADLITESFGFFSPVVIEWDGCVGALFILLDSLSESLRLGSPCGWGLWLESFLSIDEFSPLNSWEEEVIEGHPGGFETFLFMEHFPFLGKGPESSGFGPPLGSGYLLERFLGFDGAASFNLGSHVDQEILEGGLEFENGSIFLPSGHLLTEGLSPCSP